MDPERQTCVRALLRQGLDADRLADLAVHHKMLPLLHLHLKGLSLEVNGGFPLEALHSAFARNAQRMLELTGELLEIVWLLEEHGVPSVPYKGPALAAQLYGNLALRQRGDLDLVVRRADVRRARELLAGRGYRPRYPLSRGVEAFMLRSRYHETFVGSRAVVELHWAFTNRDVAFSLDLDALLPRLKQLPLGGHFVNVFAPEDLLLILCVHGAKHGWDRLEWLCGVAELVRSGEVECAAVLEMATRLGVRRMLLLGLGLAHDLLEAPLPQQVLQQVRSDRPVGRLRGEVAGRLLAGERMRVDESGNLDVFRLRLRERRRDRLRFVLDRIMTPSNPAKWAAVAIGRYYLPLHAVLRPWQLIGKLATRLRRRLSALRNTNASS